VDGLAPLAERCGAAVIDGGTDAGVMRLMGQARTAIGASFPLIGVAPAARVAIPGGSASSPGTPLEPHHTHMLLVPATDWAAGARWLSWAAALLAGNARSVTILVNGGEVAFEDVALSIQARRPVVVVAGTGRTADVLAAAAAGETSDERAATLAASGLLRVVDIASGTAALVDVVASLLDEEG
jgi:SLOG in TRPM, prokaryote